MEAIAEAAPYPQVTVGLTDFIEDYGPSLLGAIHRQLKPVFDPNEESERRKRYQAVLSDLKRKPFPAQERAVLALAELLIGQDQSAAILNAEMGTGKTMMAIALSSLMFSEGYSKSLVISPPHLVYKWRREILETVPNARVWVLNGVDTLAKLQWLRDGLSPGDPSSTGPEFYILGRVRMRMDYHWKPVCDQRKQHEWDIHEQRVHTSVFASCPRCGTYIKDSAEERVLTPVEFRREDRQRSCTNCGEALWTLHRPRSAPPKDHEALLLKALQAMPTIGRVTARRLMDLLGADALNDMLSDNIYEFVNLMDEEGELVFSDSQAKRLERHLATYEHALSQGGFQPTEFIKRYLPKYFFDLLVVDEGHEYKNPGSAQGQALGVLATQVRKRLLLTGTLMGGYGTDLFYLLWRMMPQQMIQEGYTYSQRNSLAAASMAFMRRHGVLKEVLKVTEGADHKTAKGRSVTVHTVKAPGFGPEGIVRHLLPFTVFLKLKDVGAALPTYDERLVEVEMTLAQADAYQQLSVRLTQLMREALARGDHTLLGVVINCLLAWPDCAFREERVLHPRTKAVLAHVPAIFQEDEASPKEDELAEYCLAECDKGRRVLVYTTYTGKRDTASRLQAQLRDRGLKVAVLRSSVETAKREDWVLSQVDRGIDVLITNPELVKTGLDMLEFPSIAFMQTGYNVYTVMQAARRSWLIGQHKPVEVVFFGYQLTAQMACLALMAEKIAVSMSTSGDMPSTGLDSLNETGDSIEVALARQLLSQGS
ncbi:DEAD/DEAH box helicase [Candidatus Endobugula sertula]|uniref:DEAD/DEAH box helicase n=1 Tax=Candidatus Endobugula sertula TaxID=62101 RepID=A0A1D2QPT8_9GAMM|nr:DEAD/DEAH box helicase [Candidatus Endobugula sertula]